MPHKLILVFSIFTAAVGVVAGVIRKYKIYERIKEDYIKVWFLTHGTEIVRILLDRKGGDKFTDKKHKRVNDGSVMQIKKSTAIADNHL